MQPSTIGLRNRAERAAICSRVIPTAERRAQEALGLIGLLPEVDADERLRMERPGRLFQRFAHDRIDELLALFHVARRLVEHHAIGDAFLDQQKLPVTFDDGGDGEIGTKDHEGTITG